jgi:flagellar motility protein MotE (MotC chaperone)
MKDRDKKKNSMSREEAEAIYQDLKKRLTHINTRSPNPATATALAAAEAADAAAAAAKKKASGAKAYGGSKAARAAATVAASAAGAGAGPAASSGSTLPPEILAEIRTRFSRPNRGHQAAVMMVIACAVVKVAMSGFEYLGIMSVPQAQATMAFVQPRMQSSMPSVSQGFSKEEVRMLTALDARRVELEERRHQLEEREHQLDRRDREFATKLNEIRELTDTLKVERDKGDKRRNSQLEQLSNVYGSMNPQEAAQLMEQLDVTIALSLIERMPEKRIGQILSMMKSEKALALTRLLSAAKVQ